MTRASSRTSPSLLIETQLVPSVHVGTCSRKIKTTPTVVLFTYGLSLAVGGASHSKAWHLGPSYQHRELIERSKARLLGPFISISTEARLTTAPRRSFLFSHSSSKARLLGPFSSTEVPTRRQRRAVRRSRSSIKTINSLAAYGVRSQTLMLICSCWSGCAEAMFYRCGYCDVQ